MAFQSGVILDSGQEPLLENVGIYEDASEAVQEGYLKLLSIDKLDEDSFRQLLIDVADEYQVRVELLSQIVSTD